MMRTATDRMVRPMMMMTRMRRMCIEAGGDLAGQ